LHLPACIQLTPDQLYELCQANRDLRIERTAQGALQIMPPTGGSTGDRNAELTMQLRIWAKRNGIGVAFDSSTGFMLPNGAMRSPDAAWILLSRWESLRREEQAGFTPLCPDFVVELRSPADNLSALQSKMQEYLDNGLSLGWLIDPEDKRVYVYRPQAEVECLDSPETVSADPVLPGFVLELRDIWSSR
jgi:Uma2 family endonuclease